MGTGKTYSTKYLLDSNNSSGVAGQVLSTTSTGIDWVDSGTLSTGLWLKNGNNIYNSNSGNVGVGTTGPTAKLHVLGGSNDTIDETTANFKVQGGGGNGTMFGTIASSPYTSYIQSAYVVDTSLAQYNLALNPIGGNVGIGTTLPGEKLHVIGNVFLNAGSAYIASYNNTNNYQASMRWAGLQLGNNGTNRIVAGRTNTGGGFQFWTNNTNDASDHTVTPDGIMTMAMTNTGNVGIGITNPILKLHIEGTNSLPATSGIAQNGGIRIENGVNNGVLDIGASNATGAPGWLQATDKADLSQAYKLLLNPNGGNVGIGTTSPGVKLDVNGESVRVINANPKYYLNNSVVQWHTTIATNDYRIHDGIDDRLTIKRSSGNVGIGTTSPNSKLQVVGKATSTSTVSTDAATTLVTKDYVDSSAGNPSHFRQGHKSHNLTNAFTTCLTVNLSNHTSCYVTVCCFGDWGSHSAAAYRGEFFLQNGANSYNEPGIILRQDDNTSNSGDQIVCQILDPTSTANPKNFEIQIRTTATTGTTGFTGLLTFTVQGKFNSVT